MQTDCMFVFDVVEGENVCDCVYAPKAARDVCWISNWNILCFLRGSD